MKKSSMKEKPTRQSAVQKSKVSKPKTKKKGKKKQAADDRLLDKLTEAFGDTSMLEQGDRAKQEQTTRSSRKTRSKTGMLPLGFDKQYLDRLGNETAFMNNDQIRQWIKSVSSLHLESWCKDCLCDAENQGHFHRIAEDPEPFAQAVIREVMSQHESQRTLEKPVNCPTSLHLDMKQSGTLTLRQHTAMVACLVVRDGQRGGKFAECGDQMQLHKAAVMLLISVIMDIATKGGHFSKMLLGEEQADETMDDGDLVLTGIEFGPIVDTGSQSQIDNGGPQEPSQLGGEMVLTAAEIEEVLQQHEARMLREHNFDNTGDTEATNAREIAVEMDEAGD